MTGRPPLPLGTWGRVRRYKVAPARWRAVAQYRDYDGRTRQVERHSPVGQDDDTGARAERVLMECLRDRKRAGGGKKLKSNSTVKQSVDLWLEKLEQSDKKLRTKESYREAAARYVVKGVGGVRLNEMSVETADRFIRTIVDQHGPAAAKHARVVLSGSMALAARWDLVPFNPVRDIEPISGARKVARALSADEVDQLIATLRADERAVHLDVPDVVAFMIGTGVRIGEAQALLFSDVDLAQGTAEINATMIYTKATGMFRQPAPKSKTGHRVLALPADLLAIIEARSQRAWPHNDLGLVFPNALGRPRDAVGIRRELRRVATAAGLAGVTPHSFRRTAATTLDAAGLTSRQIADHLGHAQISMTSDHYLGRKVALPEAATHLAR